MKKKYTLPKIIISITLLGWLIINPNQGSAQSKDNITNADWTTDYNYCEGYIDIFFPFFDSDGERNLLSYVTFSYKDASGAIQPLIFWNNNISGGSLGTVTGTEYKAVSPVPNPALGGLGLVKVGDVYKLHLRWSDLPTNQFGEKIEIKASGAWWNDYCCLGDGESLTFSGFSKDVFTTSINAPTSLSTTKDASCDHVRLTWTNPSNACAGKTWFNYVYRDGSPIVQTSNNYYVDASAVKGVDYKYTVRSFFQAGGSDNLSSPSNEVTGRRLGPLDPPSALTASDDRCEGEILLTWTWAAGSNPTYFRLQRSITSNFSAYVTTLSSSIPGDQRQYTDTAPILDQTFYYRAYSQNSCGDWSIAASSSATGVSPDVPTAPNMVSAVAGTDAITVTWQPYTGSGDLVVSRTLFGKAGSTEFRIDNSNDTQFIDSDLSVCQTYIYEVKVTDVCGEDYSDATVETKLVPDISDTFSSDALKVSKGFFTNKIQLSWEINQANLAYIDTYKIYRRILGDTNAPVLLNSVGNTANLYVDTDTESSILYEYFILAEGSCENTINSSKASGDPIASGTIGVAYGVGFRSAFGTVGGQIVFEGGTGVNGVKVVATKASGSNGFGLNFNGTDNYIEVNDKRSLRPTSGKLTIEAWIKPSDLIANQTILKKSDGSSGYGMEISGGNVNFYIYDGSLKMVSSDQLIIDEYAQLTGTFDGSNLELYVNGVLAESMPISSIVHSSSKLFIGSNGASGFYKGSMDDVRIWNKKKTSEEILRDFSRKVGQGESGLVAYWNLDENVGSNVYDQSKTGVIFNENHGEIKGTLTSIWTDDIPADLANYAFTDASGSYSISNMQYAGNGETFTITPIQVPHVFQPATKNIFIGEGSNVINNQDFLDKSSFKVTGFVTYDSDFSTFDGTFNNGICAVPDVFIKVDGKVLVNQDSEPVKTLADGSFEIEVPIGLHSISVEKNGHTFSVGRYPDETGFADFQDDLATSIIFKDITTQIIVGRVVGGSVQADKNPALGLSKNNIGQATLTFNSQNGCYTAMVTTDIESGEYRIELPPLKYDIEEFTIDNPGINPDVTFSATAGFNMSLDVIAALPLTIVENVTVSQAGTQQTDMAEYHKQKDFIFYAPSSLIALNDAGETGQDFIGESELEIEGNSVDITGLPFAVFKQGKDYTMTFSAMELYKNFKDFSETMIDTVKITKGNINVSNQLAVNIVETIPLTEDESGTAQYTFKAGNPNLTVDQFAADNSFTKVFTAKLDVLDSENTKVGEADWKPDPAINNTTFRGFVFGGLTDGSSFAVQGPTLVEFILRDPPGSNSTATLNKGASMTSTKSWSTGINASSSTSATLSLGTKFSTGLGFTVETEISSDISAGITIEAGINEEGELEETFSLEQEWTTNGDPLQVGARGDLFIGRATAFVFGLAANVELIPKANCSLPDVSCYGTSIFDSEQNEFDIGTAKTLGIASTGQESMFLISQNAIVNLEIPRLKQLRNNLYQQAKYTDNTGGDENNGFGLSNDNPFFEDSPISRTESGTSSIIEGPSYKFIRPNLPDLEEVIPGGITIKTPNPANIDSIRWYNQQIKLWEDAVALNEQEKYQVMNGIKLPPNFPAPESIIYSADGVALTNTKSTERTTSTSRTVEFNLTTEMAIAIGAEVGGIGGSFDQTFAIEQKISTTTSAQKSNSVSVSYTILDGDEDDRLLFNVYQSPKGNGPIFAVQGGETMCPYEGEVTSLYFKDPSTEDFVALSAATVQRERPTIAINGSTLVTNVPSSEAAVFEVKLGNENLLGQRMTYHLSVGGNANGAIVLVDGVGIGQDYTIDAGASITKQITIQKGAGSVYDYDDINLIFHSPCQFLDGISNETDIFQKLIIGAHFIPACTEAEVIEPKPNFVINNTFSSLVPISIGNYDINNQSFNKFQIQFKKSFSSDWSTIDEYFVEPDPSDPEQKAIPRDEINTKFDWKIGPNDGNYDIRVLAFCAESTHESSIISGKVDRLNPVPFGNPSPADGILSPNDEIMIQFNEVIDAGILNFSNFDIRGVVNGSDINHSTSLRYDGTSSYTEISQPINLVNTSFTIEMWVKRDALGSDQTLFAQGGSVDQEIYIGFNTSNELVFKVAGDQIETNTTYTNTSEWIHHAFVFDNESKKGNIYVNAAKVLDFASSKVSLANEYRGTGVTRIGRASNGSDRYYSGNIHELRIWNRVRNDADIAPLVNKSLTGREQGLVGNWPMDEGSGSLTRDVARSKNAKVNSIWQIDPSGKSASFDGSGYVEIDAGTIAANDEMDLTVEFWFKSPTGQNATFFSNGNGDAAGNIDGWAIKSTNDNKIIARHNSTDYELVTNNFFDDNWHHFALVINRIGSATAYIDGNQQLSFLSDHLNGFGGPKIAIGATIYNNGLGSYITEDYFSGFIDEVRLWNTARIQKQLERDKLNRLTGDEPGLIGYWSFEEFGLDNFGIPQLTESYIDQSKSINPLTLLFENNGNDGVASGGVFFSSVVPPIRLQRPVQSIAFTFVANQDKIILTTNVDPRLVENVTLDITVKNIRDLSGNLLQSPKTWIAYPDKNQVFWGDANYSVEKKIGNPASFSSTVVNSGGSSKNFTISNIPPWLTVSPTQGTIEPNSFMEIEFFINQDLNIGEYANSINLTTDFGYDEVLMLQVTVFSDAPDDWAIDPSMFEYSMNVIGQVSIDNIISNDPADILAVFVNDTIRGLAYLEYVSAYDNHQAFLTVYSNVSTGEVLEFRIWDASTGTIRGKVIPDDIIFTSNITEGLPYAPILFEAPNGILQELETVHGWQWMSFNLSSTDLISTNVLLQNLPASDGDQIKGIEGVDVFTSANGWSGSLGTLDPGQMYKLYLSNYGAIRYEGNVIKPSSKIISIVPGWNWLGFLPQANMSVNDALASLSSTSGDIIKSQLQFAIYDQGIGWIGSLKSLKAGVGYMLNNAIGGTLYYPDQGLNNGRTYFGTDDLSVDQWPYNPALFANNMTIIAELNSSGDISDLMEYRVGAFVNNKVRGIAEPTYDSKSKTYKFFLTVGGDVDSDNISFKVLEASGEISDIEESVSFQGNSPIGSIENPLNLTFSPSLFTDDIVVYPNPFNETIDIKGELNNAGNLDVSIVDLTGKKVKSLYSAYKDKGKWHLSWDGNNQLGRSLVYGIYMIRVQTGTTVTNIKVIKE
jgi:hypothetical protein